MSVLLVGSVFIPGREKCGVGWFEIWDLRFGGQGDDK